MFAVLPGSGVTHGPLQVVCGSYREARLEVEMNVSGTCSVSTEDMMYQTVLKQRCYFDRMFQIAKLNSLTVISNIL